MPRGGGVCRRWGIQASRCRLLFGVTVKVLYKSVAMAGALSKNANNHPITHFTWVNFIVCRLRLSKAVKTDSSVVFE